jgi:pimeloyl-ACP methyl ester carboxylesterase
MSATITLTDGRTLQWADNGVDSDSALVLHHGTTISLVVWNAWMAQAASLGVRAIAINRPGVDASTRKPGRQISDDIDDTRQLLSRVGIKSFVSIGWSGGGARALGSALIDGCLAVHTIAGISPINLDDPETVAMIPDARIEQLRKNLADYQEVLKDRGGTYEEDMNLSYEDMFESMKEAPNFGAFEADYAVFAEDFRLSIRQALINGIETEADDYSANIHPWGFALTDVAVPVTIWHGDSDDMVGLERGEYNHRHLPESTLVPLPRQDHVSIMVEHRDAILGAAIKDLRAKQ